MAKALGLLAGMHSASPAFVDEVLNKAAQEISEELSVARRADINKNAKYGTNICINDGPIEELAMKCASQWYSKVKDYNWLNPRLTPAVQPFVQLVWRGNKRLGVGISKNSSGKYVLVVIFDSPANQHQLAQNVWPTEGRRIVKRLVYVYSSFECYIDNVSFCSNKDRKCRHLV